MLQEEEEAQEQEELGEQPVDWVARQQDAYHPCINTWWCGCPSYKSSPNHVCKHLIRSYSKWFTGFSPTSIPIPPYGHVNRQNCSPVLHLYKLHDAQILQQTPLHSIRGEDDVPRPLPAEIEQQQLEEDGGRIVRPNVDDMDVIVEEAVEEDEEEDEEEEEDETAWEATIADLAENEARTERIQRGEERKERIELFRTEVLKLAERLTGVLEYPAGHAHLMETPDPSFASWRAWMRWGENQDILRDARVRRTTFGVNRTGHIFANP
jgi:hypothetical protein